ncbi:hypothetical protein Undi14_04565 [Undibacterium sp. 14-3-2]|uniref:hypothetical protein n=1 Tax=Undibacterium sp. 14-3-2 TaxID=2800129 RepID=UPI0019038E1D|nr:hypothetical protein [Undibacterium sp. 14-3-2]MBK1889295.1 hypothetical protein [Undibacterium sp. 14-3-2]
MKSIFIILSVFFTYLCLPAFAAEGRWTQGYGQGNLEYFIDQKGMQLYIGCPTQNGSAEAASSVSLRRLSDNKEIKQFTIIVNGISYDAPFDADSHVGAQNFLSLLDGLRKTNAVVKFGNQSMTFPKSNAATVIPVYGKKFECNLM